MMTTFYLLVTRNVVMVASSMLPEPLKEETKLLVLENFLKPLQDEAYGSGLGNYRLLFLFVLVTFVVLFLIFR